MFLQNILNFYDKRNKFNSVHNRYKGGGVETEYKVTPEQREMLKTVLDWGKPTLERSKPLESYEGDIYAGLTDEYMQGVEDYRQKMGTTQNSRSELYKDIMNRKPVFEYDPEQTYEDWNENYARPVMESWQENVASGIKESMNIGSGVFGRNAADYMMKQSSDFYSQKVMPSFYDTLQREKEMGFRSEENALERAIQNVGLPYNEFSQMAGVEQSIQQDKQNQLSAQYQEFQRTDPMNLAALMAQTSTAETKDNIYKQGTDWGALGGQLATAMILTGS